MLGRNADAGGRWSAFFAHLAARQCYSIAICFRVFAVSFRRIHHSRSAEARSHRERHGRNSCHYFVFLSCDTQKIQPRLRAIEVPEIAKTMEVPRPYAALIRSRRRRPQERLGLSSPRYRNSKLSLVGSRPLLREASRRDREL
jgi:hypothetical protein